MGKYTEATQAELLAYRKQQLAMYAQRQQDQIRTSGLWSQQIMKPPRTGYMGLEARINELEKRIELLTSLGILVHTEQALGPDSSPVLDKPSAPGV